MPQSTDTFTTSPPAGEEAPPIQAQSGDPVQLDRIPLSSPVTGERDKIPLSGPVTGERDKIPLSSPVIGERDKIPLSSPVIGKRELELVNRVLQTRWLSMGPMIRRFEGAVAEYVGVKHAVAVSSGTAGLHLCAIAAGLGPGDEVITTPFSFVASANCILYTGATPVFVDIDPDTLNIDPQKVRDAITPRTSAILPVHVFGQPCAMDRLVEIARQHDLVLIEDACEALGAEYQGQPAGTFGEAAVFAFYPNKQMTTGEGGMIVTGDDRWASLFRSLRNQGRAEGAELKSGGCSAWLNHVRLGYNYRLDEMSAALGLAQMERLDDLLTRRAWVAHWYNERLAHLPTVKIPWVCPQVNRMSWFVYVVRLVSDAAPRRDQIMEELERHGVPARPYFSPLHLQPFYRRRFGFGPGDFPVTESIAASTLALPFSGAMREAQVERVCEILMETIQ